MHLDVCRHFFQKEFIKRYIDLMALHKLNVFHWHLTEDQGWRIEIKRYPRLTEIGAWRVDREDQPWDKRLPPQNGEKATYGGFYTQEEVREIVAYAGERFITVVPEIEMPAHATAALAAYPELSCTGGPFAVMPGGVWPIVDIFCAGNEGTFEFLEGVLDEVAGLFPGRYIHIGGDEAAKENWKNCPKCQSRIRSEGLKDEAGLQSYFIRRVEKILIAHHKRLIGWDEILEGGLAPEATVMSWRGMEGGIAAARAGHDIVMSPTSHCYFDYYQTESDEPKPTGACLPLEKVYSFEPVPDDLEPDRQRFILGAQGNLWTEYVPTPERAEFMALPRMCALAEAVWSPKDKRNLNDFLERMVRHYRYLDLMDVHYCRPARR
jgi:hexosaminidase